MDKDKSLYVKESELSGKSNIMDFQMVTEGTLKRILPEGWCVLKTDTYKNNGVVYHGINVTHEDSRVGVCIYLDSYLEQFREGREYTEIIRNILRRIVVCSRDEQEILEGTSECIENYDMAKKRIHCRLVNTNANREFLKGVPNIPFLDLSILFYVQVTDTGESSGNMTIRNEQLENWKVDKETLMKDAIRNGQVCTEEICSLLKSALEENGCKEELEALTELKQACDETVPKMMVMTNPVRQYGAYGMLYTDKLLEIAEKVDKNLFILPSSIHDTILVQDMGVSEEKVREISAMVKEFNKSQLLREEILSNSVYYFDREIGKVSLLVQGEEI